jgi:aspartyl-tRNA(Asn)/glutamyl-tRNA(Gln) amidotransferase subunit B
MSSQYKAPLFDGWEAVIGLEVHAQLLTKSKAFCSDSTDFHSPPNQNISVVSCGHPGTLPVLNKEAVRMAIQAGLALNCKIQNYSEFSRKNYFYPDLPKGYQITQYEKPICLDGEIIIEVGGTPQKPELAVPKRIGITRIHLEEDAGKSIHAEGESLINLNRAGVPLIEIVSEPDMRSPEEAGQYLRKLRNILMYIGVCDGNMQEGSFRCDANVSVRRAGDTKFGVRAEIKNVNSFRFVEKAIEHEIYRQIQILESGGQVVQETRLYDPAKNVTISMRSKEEAHDYRYFPEPDLLPLIIDDNVIADLKSSLPELPDAKRDRFVKNYGIPLYDANVITSSKKLAEFFEEALEGVESDAKMVSNYVMGELLRLLKEEEKEIDEIDFNPKHLTTIIKMIKAQTISNTIGKQVFEEVYKTKKDPETIVKEKGLAQVSDTSAIEKAVDEVIKENASQWAELCGGKEKLFGFFVGQVMKKMAGKANPGLINEIIKKKKGG